MRGPPWPAPVAPSGTGASLRTGIGRTGSAALQLDLGVDSSSMALAGFRRTRQLLRAALTSHFDVGSSTHLGLGLGLDTAMGDDSTLQLGPRLRWDQGLGQVEQALKRALDPLREALLRAQVRLKDFLAVKVPLVLRQRLSTRCGGARLR